MKCYVQLRKELLDYLEDLMTQDSLIWSTVTTRSKKNGSNVSKMSTPNVKSMDTKSSNPLDFYSKHLNHAFMPTPDFEGCRRSAKEQYENATDHFEGIRECLNEGLHQMPDHQAAAKAAANDERRQVLIHRVIWDGSFDRLKFLGILLKDIMDKLV
jgi:hypothetical protein